MGHLAIPLIGMSLAAFLFLAGGANVSDDALENGRVCNTMDCLQVANDILNSMNKSVDPCDNFFEFACGNWHKNNPEYEYYQFENQKLTALSKHRLRDELELQSSPGDILPVQKIKKIYRSCMEMTHSEGMTSILAILDQVKGFPMIMEPGTWNSSAITWQEINRYYAELIGLNTFYDLTTVDAPSEHGILQISPRKKLYDRRTMQYLYGMLIKVNNVTLDKKKYRKELSKLNKFEKELDKISETPSDLYFENRDLFIEWWNDNIESSDLKNDIILKMDVSKLLNITKSPNTEETPIKLMNVDYFKQLPKLLELTDKRIIDNFVHSHFIMVIGELVVSYDNTLVDQQTPNWVKCDMSGNPVAEYLFIRKYFGSNIKAAVNKTMIYSLGVHRGSLGGWIERFERLGCEAEEMVRNIKEAFKRQIMSSNWLSDEVKSAAIEKVNHREFILGHEEWYTNETALIEYYEDLTISDNYVENYLRLKKLEWEAEMRRWGKPIKYKKWRYTPMKVNAEDVNEFNYVNIPAAVFQSPLLDESVPHYFSYGKMGYPIGYQVGRAFDDKQYSFFESGINDTRVKSVFNESAECLIDVFHKLTNNSGNSTFMGILPDWYGIQAVLDAYKEVKNITHSNGELKLPGLQKYTDFQMFFLSLSQFFCGDSYEWYESQEYYSGPHRVIGTLSNTKAFAEAFKCPKDSPMNPEKKCNIWKQKPHSL